MKHRIREIEKDLNTMDEDLHGDRELITTFDSEINELKEGILTIKESTNQMVDEINNKVKKEMFPRVDELEGHTGDTEKRIDGIGKRAENVANASNIIEKEIEKLEEEYRKYFQRLDRLVSKFWNSDEKFLIVHREIFRKFGKNEEALLNSLEFGFENYNIEDANVSERMDLTIVEIEQKIKSAPQYNSVILQFWVEVLKYIYKMSYKKAKENGGYRGPVDIRWQRGIEEILNGLNRMFEDKDALIAMKIVNDYEVPLFHDVQKIWDQYQRTDHETKKRLYEKMRRDSVNPTYLKIGIPIVLSRAIMDIARKPWYHSDLAQFIWFCSVVYDETWKHYGDLLNEMVRRIQGG
jgi:archaellum component FlaC